MCFQGQEQPMTSTVDPALASASNQFLGQLQQGFGQGATALDPNVMQQWQQAAQAPGFTQGLGDVFAGGYQAPEAWGQAQDIYGQAAGYQPTAPGAWGTAEQGLTEMAQTGMPTMSEQYAQTAWKPYQRQAMEAGKQAMEQAGMGGMRISSPAASQMADIYAGAGERFGSQMEQARMGAAERAMGRRMQAYGGLTGLGGQQAGMERFGQQMRMGAGQGLAGLGQMQQQAPLNWAQAGAGLGGAMQRMNLQGMQPQLSEQFRMMAENNPWMQPMMQGLGTMGGYMQQMPQQYQPGFGTQMLNMAGGMLPFAFMGGG